MELCYDGIAMNMKWIVLVAAVVLSARAHADIVVLKDGTKVEGSVVAFKNQKFELQTEKGQKNSYAPAELQRIDFAGGEENGVPAQLTHRTKGEMKGTVLEFADGKFRYRDAQGKVEYLPAMLVTTAAFAGGGAKDIEIITHGARVDIEKKLAEGQVTLIDFYADWCGPCRFISPHLESVAKDDPAVVLRKVDIVKWGSAVAQQYKINSVPQVWVYGKDGKLVGKVMGASKEQVNALVAKAKQ